MVSASWYCNFVRIDTSGGYITREIPLVRAFFQQQFPEFANQTTLETSQDKFIQRQLIELLRDTPAEPNIHLMSECSLRCYISGQILRTCVEFDQKFGGNHGFTSNDLLGIVLNDVDITRSILNNSQQASYQPFAARILQTFNPEQSSLSTWTTMLTRQQDDLKNFLLECGVFLQSDWSILNEKEPEELQWILSHIYGLPNTEIEHACVLLSSYHSVYRSQRRQKGARGRCTPPTEEQLNEICNKAALSYSSKEVMKHLLNIAGYLRQYHVSNKTGVLPGESIDRPEIGREVDQTHLSKGGSDESENEQAAFLERYHQQLTVCLEQGIEQRSIFPPLNLTAVRKKQ
jgi:hypothetical protein